MKKYLRFLGHLVVCAIFLLAVWLLYHKLKSYSISEIRESIQQIPWFHLGFSFFLMIINYIILVGYDWLALKAIHKSLPLSKVGLVSFIGQAVSYNFGALLGGTTVRYRFYTAWGFSLAEIVRLVLMLAVTFWVGALGLSGVVFIIAPPHIPDAILDNMPIKDIRVLGVILSAIAFSYLAICLSIRKPLRIFGKEFVFPSPQIAFAQCIVAGIDLIAAAACMYVLLPETTGIHFIDFLPGYLLAQVAVVLTHIPGGVGIFELVILELTHTPQEQAVFAAVLIFRLIYYIIPLLGAAVLLAIYEAQQNRLMLQNAGRWLTVLSHSIASYLTFVGGLIMLVSATFPTVFSKLPEIMQVWPKSLLGIGHFTAAISGAALLFVAYGLERRQSKAFGITVILFCTGIAGLLFKGFSWESALMEAIILIAIISARKRFYRKSFFLMEKIPFYWLIACSIAVAFVFLLGWFIYHPVWDRAATWGFDRPFNASRTLLAYIAVTAILAAAWIWRFMGRFTNNAKKKSYKK